MSSIIGWSLTKNLVHETLELLELNWGFFFYLFFLLLKYRE